MPNVGFRGLNENYTANTGVINPVTESLKIYGGISQTDRSLTKTQGNVNDIRAIHDGLKAKAAALKFTTSFFNGDSQSDPKEFDGLARRLTGNQVIQINGSLTLEALDRVIDRVVGRPDVIFCSKAIRRKINALMRAAGQAKETVTDAFGRQINAYGGIPIETIDEDSAGAEVLGFDEASSTCSLYVCRFGVMEFLSGLQASDIEVLDLGLKGIFFETLIEHISSIALFHGKSAARLSRIRDDETTYTSTTTTTSTSSTTTTTA